MMRKDIGIVGDCYYYGKSECQQKLEVNNNNNRYRAREALKAV